MNQETKKIVVFSPNPKSLYTNSVCELLLRNGIIIQAVIVKKFTIERFKSEFSRDGKRLLSKIWKKLVLGKFAYRKIDNFKNILNFRDDWGISLDNVKDLVKNGTKVEFVNDLNSVEVENSLKEFQPDLIIFTGGGLIKENILNCSGRGVLNCHMGILPMYRGMDVVEWPILCNDFDNLGLTVHLMEKGVDTGPILSRMYIKPEPFDTIDSLRTRFEPFMVRLMVETSINYLNNNISPVFQDDTEGKQFFVLNSKMKKIAQSKFQHFLLEKSNC